MKTDQKHKKMVQLKLTKLPKKMPKSIHHGETVEKALSRELEEERVTK